MPRLRLISSLAALSLVSACATRAPAPTVASAASAPLPVAGYDWSLHRDAQEAILAYGVPDSDEVKLKLSCRTGSGALELGAVLDKPTRSLLLESGGDTERYPAASEPAGIVDGYYAEAAAAAKDPVFQRFRRLGWLAVWDGDQRRAYAAYPATLPEIERFFAVCA